MPNGRKMFLYGLLGLLLSIMLSSFLFFVVYPQTIRTVIIEDTIHEGDLIISGNQELIVNGATYFNDGNIIVQDQAKVILKNAVLVLNQSDPRSWFGGREPTIEEPINYPLYNVEVRDNARFEAFNSTIKSPTTERFAVYMRGKAKIVLRNVYMDADLGFDDESSGIITDSCMESGLGLQGNSVVTISNSTLPQFMRIFQNAQVSIFDSRTIRCIMIEIWQYYNTMYFDQTRLEAKLFLENSSFRIMGNVVFDEGSGISHLVKDNATYWNWIDSTITRSFDINVAYLNGTAVSNAELSLYDYLGAPLWNGVTDEKGKASVEIEFTTENFLESFELVVATHEWNLTKNLTLLSSTPVYMSLPLP